jgi:hypothetical protein
VFRVLLAHGRALPYRPQRQRQTKRPWPEWVSYRPNQVWGYDLSTFPGAGTQALAIVDLVSRKWIDHMLCAEATSVQVQALFTRALDREGPARRDHRPRRAARRPRRPGPRSARPARGV